MASRFFTADFKGAALRALLAASLLGVAQFSAFGADKGVAEPTFSKDIAPIFQRVPELPSSGLDRADGVDDLQRCAALGPVDQRKSRTAGNAALAYRSKCGDH